MDNQYEDLRKEVERTKKNIKEKIECQNKEITAMVRVTIITVLKKLENTLKYSVNLSADDLEKICKIPHTETQTLILIIKKLMIICKNIGIHTTCTPDINEMKNMEFSFDHR